MRFFWGTALILDFLRSFRITFLKKPTMNGASQPAGAQNGHHERGHGPLCKTVVSPNETAREAASRALKDLCRRRVQLASCCTFAWSASTRLRSSDESSPALSEESTSRAVLVWPSATRTSA